MKLSPMCKVDARQHELWKSIRTDRSVYVGNNSGESWGFLYSEESRGDNYVDILRKQAIEDCRDVTGFNPTWARISWSVYGKSERGGVLGRGIDGGTVPATIIGYDVNFDPSEQATSMTAWSWASLFSTVKATKSPACDPVTN